MMSGQERACVNACAKIVAAGKFVVNLSAVVCWRELLCVGGSRCVLGG